MVDLKPAKQDHRQTPIGNRFGYHRYYQLLWFILASVLVHSLAWLFLGLYQRSKPVAEEVDSKPIEFVVVPEESEEPPPPETQKRATENSVAEKNTESETTALNDEIEDDIPVTSAPPPQPEPAAPTQPAPTPAPAPEPEPTPEPELAEPPAAQQPILSGSDANPITTPEPEPEAAEPESSVATRLPPPKPTEAVPEPEIPPATTSPEDNNSASSLLGGDYQKTLANGGADAFFSPEALAYKDVLNPGQLNALKDINLGPYFDEVKRRVKRNWNPSYRVEEYTTFLTFDIEKNGQITGLRVTQSSGSEKVDQESLAAVQNSAPFDPLPAEFPLEALEVKFSFNIYIY
ncbi:MAG: TonB family protein [Pleurocapsa sp.]